MWPTSITEEQSTPNKEPAVTSTIFFVLIFPGFFKYQVKKEHESKRFSLTFLET